MVLNREEAALAAERTKTNVPGTCQLVVRGWFDAPSVGDFDGDGAADAEDGWKSEPTSARHTDKNAPRGVPGAYVGGRNDFGHRTISLGGGVWRSTDFNGVTKRYQAGVVGNGTVDEIGRAMGVTWAGWSETIDGIHIPLPPPAGPQTRGDRVDAALRKLKAAERLAKEGTERDTLLDRAIKVLTKIPTWRKRS